MYSVNFRVCGWLSGYLWIGNLIQSPLGLSKDLWLKGRPTLCLVLVGTGNPPVLADVERVAGLQMLTSANAHNFTLPSI